MPLPTKICKHCGKPIVEKTPTRRLYCSDAHKQSAWRDRQRAPVLIELEPVVHRHERTGRKRRLKASGWIRLPANYGGWRHDLDRVIWKLTARVDRVAEEVWPEIRWLALEEFIQALHPLRRPAEFQHIPVLRALAIWRCRWRSHPDLSPVGRLEILTLIPQDYSQALAAIESEKEETMLEIEKVKLQNELILARQQEGLARQQETLDRLERLQDLAAETFARVADTARRVGERFPNNAEVAAAVDRLLEDVGATVAEEDDLS